MILDCVVCSALKNVGNISPFVGFVTIQKIKNPLFFAGPWSLPLDHRVEVVVPSLSALLSYSAWEMVGHDSPFLWSINIDQMQQQPVFNIHPWTLHQGWIEHLLPSMQTLYVSSALEIFCNSLPVLPSIDSDCLSELLVFCLSPMTFHFCIVASRTLLLLIFGRASFVQMRILHLMSDQVLLSLSVIVQISYSSGQYGFGWLLLQMFSSSFHVFIMLDISWDTTVSSISTMLTISKLLRIVLVLLLAAII